MNLTEQLTRDEGLRLIAYQDTKGLWTIGVGHLLPDPTNPKWKGYTIDRTTAEAWLAQDILKHNKELYVALPWVRALDEARAGVFANMAFNLGVPRLLGFTGFLSAAQQANWPMAAIEMLDSKWHREDVGPRAVRLAKQIVTGKWQ